MGLVVIVDVERGTNRAFLRKFETGSFSYITPNFVFFIWMVEKGNSKLKLKYMFFNNFISSNVSFSAHMNI